jgi:translocation and assembly module TamA
MIITIRQALLLCGVSILLTVSPVCAVEPSVQVEVKGLKGDQLENVVRATALPPGIVRNGRIEERWLERYAGRVPKIVADALEPFGHYRSEADVEINPTGEGSYQILVTVTPGPQTIIRKITVNLTGEGAQKKKLRRKVKEFPLKKGDPLDHQLYEQGKLELRLEADALGYLQAYFTSHIINVEPDEGIADIELVLETGPRFYFGATTFVDETESFDEDFLRRFLTYRQGDVFSHKKLHRTRVGFYGANRFKGVLVVPLMDEVVDQHVPIEVRLTPGKQQRLRPGIGYGTNTGARLSLSYHNMRVRETPHALLVDLTLAEKMQFFETSYTIPQAGSSANNLIFTVGLRQEDINTYETQMIYTEVEKTYGLGLGKIGSFYLRYLYEDSDVGTDNNIAKLLIPGIRYYQRSYDDLINPKSGYQFRIELRGSHDNLLSNVTLGQVIAAGSFMLPLTKELTLHTRVEGATTVKDDDLSEVPPSMRFFVGGDNSVRGYAYKSRGPRDEFGDVTGGDSLLVGSAEIEYSLNDQWGLAVFYDAGTAFNASHDIDVIQGAGIGVRRYTQIGPIKLDFAKRVNDGHNGIRIHFSVGFDI